MIQCNISENNKYSIGEQAQLGLECGVEWLVISVPSDDYLNQREMLVEIVGLCKEKEAFLTITDNPEAARELGLHGILQTSGVFEDALRLRDELGPEAIIGFEIKDDDITVIDKLSKADIDYALLDVNDDIDSKLSFVNRVRMTGSSYPVVFRGRFTSDQILEYIKSGVSGFELTDAFINEESIDNLRKAVEIASK